MRSIHYLYLLIDRERNRKKVERIFIYTAFSLFLVHILLIWFSRNTDLFPSLFNLLGQNYLSALYTPFSIILVYEVYFMILAIPLSFTNSIRKQYEIISLIIIRRVFKDISEFSTFDAVLADNEKFLAIIFDLGGGIALFALVAVFHHVSRDRRSRKETQNLQNFIRFKEVMSIGLAILLFILAAYSFFEWAGEVYYASVGGIEYNLNVHTIFFEELFTVMIFSDVLIFIASFLYTKKYEILFRNAGYVASTVLIRISLTVENNYGILIALGALLTGILVQLVCRYFQWLADDNTEKLYPP